MDIERIIKDNSISEDRLEQIKARESEYLSIIGELFDKFASFNNPFSISYIDKNKVVLISRGNRKDLILKEGLVIGKQFGLTAVEEAFRQIKPVELKGEEHTFEYFRDKSCAAAPVRDLEDEVIGVVSISSYVNDYLPNALDTVNLIVTAIQAERRLLESVKRARFLEKYAEVIAENNRDGVLVLDKNANVQYINKTGASMLKVDRSFAIGRNVCEIVDFTPVVLEVFKTQKGYIDKEFIIDSPSRGTLHFIKTAMVLRDSNGEFAGVVDFFREIERVRKFVASYIGAEARFSFIDIKGESEEIQEAIRIAKIASHSNSPVLIIGETGTGKEMFAQAIHFASERASFPFVALNCGAVPRDLAESEFFGYEPGAFTDADKKGRPGKFELANGGIIFLDEIEELPLALQTKLLRVLEERVVTRVGGSKSIKVDVRVFAATNKDLKMPVDQGSFRKDLYYRLNVIQLEIPPLRNRRGDIPILVSHFIQKFNKEFRKEVKGYTDEFIKILMTYEFPGNVRELQNIIERAVALYDVDYLTAEHLPKEVVSEKHDYITPENVEDAKKAVILRVLKDTDYNISLAAKKLGISRPTLYNLIKKYNISDTSL